MEKVAVLITCFNRKEKTLSCLASLFNQAGINERFTMEVFLVDDGSTDGTGDAVRERFPLVNVIPGNGSLYWNRGMYTAWDAASKKDFDFYLWVNDDTLLYNCAIAQMIEDSKSVKDRSIICGCTESPENPGELTYGGGKHEKGAYCSNYPDGKVKACEIINGNCVLIPKRVFEKVGNLDWKFNHSIGDNDYSLRAKKLGIQSYTASFFVGTCAKHENVPLWCRPEIALKKRIKNLYSPAGNPPMEYFVFERRHFGLFPAIIHYLSTHFRVMIPSLWMPRSN